MSADSHFATISFQNQPARINFFLNEFLYTTVAYVYESEFENISYIFNRVNTTYTHIGIRSSFTTLLMNTRSEEDETQQII